MSLIKETHKAILEECKKTDQVEFMNTLVRFMEQLIKSELTPKDKNNMAESLINSYKKEIKDDEN